MASSSLYCRSWGRLSIQLTAYKFWLLFLKIDVIRIIKNFPSLGHSQFVKKRPRGHKIRLLMKFFKSSHVIYHSIRNLMLITKSIESRVWKFSRKKLQVNSQTYLMAFFIFKACVRYFSLFIKDECIFSLIRTKYIEKKFTLQLFFLPTVSRMFILSWATTCYLPLWNLLFRKNNCMCNRDKARDVAACPDE